MAGVQAMPTKTDMQFEIENDARTLIEAEFIKKDTKRVKAARAHIEKKMVASKAALNKSR